METHELQLPDNNQQRGYDEHMLKANVLKNLYQPHLEQDDQGMFEANPE